MTRRARITPLGALVRGAAAGLAGTLAMDVLWYSRYRRDGGEDGFADWELSAGTTSYERAGAPAQVGKRIFEGALHREPPPQSARAMNVAVHMLTGVTWGVAHAVVTTSTRASSAAIGPATGVTAWAASYALLTPLGIYQPITEYPRAVLWQDLSAHLVFGASTGVAFGTLAQAAGGT
jgi:hypothetical protein